MLVDTEFPHGILRGFTKLLVADVNQYKEHISSNRILLISVKCKIKFFLFWNCEECECCKSKDNRASCLSVPLFLHGLNEVLQPSICNS